MKKKHFVMVGDQKISGTLDEVSAVAELMEKDRKQVQMLQEFLPEYYINADGAEMYLGGTFQWNEIDDSLIIAVIQCLYGNDEAGWPVVNKE